MGLEHWSWWNGVKVVVVGEKQACRYGENAECLGSVYPLGARLVKYAVAYRQSGQKPALRDIGAQLSTQWEE